MIMMTSASKRSTAIIDEEVEASFELEIDSFGILD
jgi:putative transposon-encoded protein